MVFALNNGGQFIGVAENSTHDPACPSPQVLDFEPVPWGPGAGQILALPPLPGDTVGFALAINDAGQVVGSTGNCANTGVTAVGLLYGSHAVLWENGRATSIGGLGGAMGKAAAINNLGQVAGFASLPGDQIVHSFLWTKAAVMQDLGGLGADVLSDPAGINNSGQVVGGSCDMDGNCRAFIWQNQSMMDLNSLILANSSLYLAYALGINDRGEIIGFAVQHATGDVHAYLATPSYTGASAKTLSRVGESESRPMILPENARRELRRLRPALTAAGLKRP